MRFPTCARSLIALLVVLAKSQVSLAESPFPMGMNLSGTADWSTEIVFVDAFKISRPWISQKEGAPWGQGGDLAVNERGWVTKLAAKQTAETLMYVDIGNHYPGGEYVCMFEGKGDVQFGGAASGK